MTYSVRVNGQTVATETVYNWATREARVQYRRAGSTADVKVVNEHTHDTVWQSGR